MGMFDDIFGEMQPVQSQNQNFNSVSSYTSPEWYGGDAGSIKTVNDRAIQNLDIPYQQYEGQRVAPFSPLQQQAFQMAQSQAANPTYQNMFNQGRNAVTNALGQDISGKLAPYLQKGTQNPVQGINQYMNPHRAQVVDQIGQYGTRNLHENILPGIRDQFINSGQYGSTNHQDFANRAVRDVGSEIANAQSRALERGYDQALQTSIGQQDRNLQAGQLSANAQGADAHNQLVGANTLQGLGIGQQQQGLQNTAFINQLGGQQQQQAQANLNVPFQNFLEKRAYPHVQLNQATGVLKGLPVNYTTNTSGTGTSMTSAPAPNQEAQMLGTIAGLAGTFGGFAEGGHVKKIRHYAEGGAVLNPIQSGVNSALDTSELQEIREIYKNLRQPQKDPRWGALAKMGFTMAASRNPSFLGSLGEGGVEGLEEYNRIKGDHRKSDLDSMNILSMIDKTKRWQATQDQQHQLAQEKFGHEKSMNEASLGLNREKFNFMKSQGSERSPNIIKGPDDLQYLVKTDPGTGEIEAIPLKGMKRKGEFNLGPGMNGMVAPEMSKADEDRLKDLRGETKGTEEELITAERANKNLKESGVKTGFFQGFIPSGASTERALLQKYASKLQGNEANKSAGPLTEAKIRLARDQNIDLSKPNKANEVLMEEKIGDDNVKLRKNKFILTMADTYKIPPGYSEVAYDSWVKNNRKGDLKDYLKDVLSGKIPFPSVDDKSTPSQQNLPSVSPTDQSNPYLGMSREQLEKERAGLTGQGG